MPDIDKVMGVDSADIDSIFGVARADIDTVMGVTVPSLGDWKGTRAIIIGGNHYNAAGYGRSVDSIQYKTLTTDGNTSAFDDLSLPTHDAAGSGSNGTRIVYGGGRTYAASGSENHVTIEYMVAASTGSVADAGDLEVGSYAGGRDGASNGTLCFFVGGSNGLQANMEQMTISSTSGAADAGDLQFGTSGDHCTSNGDSKFLIIGLGTAQAGKTAIDEHNFDTSASSTAYGNVATVGIGMSGSVCATNRVVTAGGFVSSGPYVLGTRMQFFPVASSADGDSSDEADLVVGVMAPCGTSDGTRGEFYGGEATSANNYQQNDIQKITIASLSNATDIGDLTTEDTYGAGNHWSGSDSGGITNASAQTGT